MIPMNNCLTLIIMVTLVYSISSISVRFTYVPFVNVCSFRWRALFGPYILVLPYSLTVSLYLIHLFHFTRVHCFVHVFWSFPTVR
jgi:hypothetical protein